MFRESRLLSQSIDAPKPLGNTKGDTPVHDNFDVEEYGRKRREKREQLHALEVHDATTQGFAEIKETPEVLEQFSTAEKLEILQSMLEEAQELPEEILRRVEQVEILRLVVENSIIEISAPKTTLQKWANTGTNVRKMLRLPTPAEDRLERYAADMQQMLDTDIPKVIQEVVQGEKTLQEILHDFPRLQKVSEEAYRWDDAEHYKDDPGFGMNLTETASQEDMLSQYNLLMRYYRWRQNYEGAEDLAYRFIGEDLQSTMNENDRGALRVQAEEKVNRLVEKNKTAWMNNGDHPMTEEDVSNYREGLIEQEYRHHIMHQGAVQAKKTHKIPGSGNDSEHSIAKMHMYNQYVDMRDPHGHWFNVKDENWDLIVEELVINAPMIIASGGVSGILSAGARTVALRMAPSLIVKQGAKLTAKNIAKRTAVGVPALLAEGAAFEMIHSGLQGELLSRDLPEWASSILWSSFTLGMIHGGAKVGERAFTKGAGDTAKATLLGKYVNDISNPSVRECAKQCLVKGHTEAASMLIAGAFQNGAYTGDIDAFYEGFGGDEWLHAYITVGALKVSRAGLETASGKVFAPTEATKSLKKTANVITYRTEKKDGERQETHAALQSESILAADQQKYIEGFLRYINTHDIQESKNILLKKLQTPSVVGAKGMAENRARDYPAELAKLDPQIRKLFDELNREPLTNNSKRIVEKLVFLNRDFGIHVTEGEILRDISRTLLQQEFTVNLNTAAQLENGKTLAEQLYTDPVYRNQHESNHTMAVDMPFASRRAGERSIFGGMMEVVPSTQKPKYIFINTTGNKRGADADYGNTVFVFNSDKIMNSAATVTPGDSLLISEANGFVPLSTIQNPLNALTRSQSGMNTFIRPQVERILFEHPLKVHIPGLSTKNYADIIHESRHRKITAEMLSKMELQLSEADIRTINTLSSLSRTAFENLEADATNGHAKKWASTMNEVEIQVFGELPLNNKTLAEIRYDLTDTPQNITNLIRLAKKIEVPLIPY